MDAHLAMPQIRIATYQSGIRINEVYVDQPIIIGRRDPRKGDPPPVALHRTATETRLIVADFQQKEMSRRWIEASPVDAYCFQLKNLHQHCPVNILGDHDILPGESRRFEHETMVDLGASMAVRMPVRSAIRSLPTSRRARFVRCCRTSQRYSRHRNSTSAPTDSRMPIWPSAIRSCVSCD